MWGVELSSGNASIETVTIIGVNIGKQVVQFHGINQVGAIVCGRRLRRDRSIGTTPVRKQQQEVWLVCRFRFWFHLAKGQGAERCRPSVRIQRRFRTTGWNGRYAQSACRLAVNCEIAAVLFSRPVTSLGSGGAQEGWLGFEYRRDVRFWLSERCPQAIAKFAVQRGRSDLHEHVSAVE